MTDEAILRNLEEVFARLSTHEFVLEVMLASSLADLSPGQAAKFREQLIEQSRKAYGPISGDPGVIASMQRVNAASIAMTEELMTKVAERERNLRSLRPA